MHCGHKPQILKYLGRTAEEKGLCFLFAKHCHPTRQMGIGFTVLQAAKTGQGLPFQLRKTMLLVHENKLAEDFWVTSSSLK